MPPGEKEHQLQKCPLFLGRKYVSSLEGTSCLLAMMDVYIILIDGLGVDFLNCKGFLYEMDLFLVLSGCLNQRHTMTQHEALVGEKHNIVKCETSHHYNDIFRAAFSCTKMINDTIKSWNSGNKQITTKS